MKILTFDIEEWYLEEILHGGRSEKFRQFDGILDNVLSLLDNNGIKATFFCLGKMAEEYPDVVKKIDSCGHEIGCHSNLHKWINKMDRREAFEDTRTALGSLESLIGKKVVSYRAPAFSIGESSMWAFEMLAENGIKNDASVFPISRDFGGYPSFGSAVPTMIKTGKFSIKEFPICIGSMFGKKVAFSGGGYFRLYPLSFIYGQMKKMDYAITYFHIADLIDETRKMMSREQYEEYFREPGTLNKRFVRYVKSNIGASGTMSKMDSLLAKYRFVGIEEASRIIDWKEQPIKQI